VNRSAGNPLPDEPWPVSARNLLSKRENKLYQALVALYPDHKILVQVALSQLIGIDRNHPESESIRARYKQLVADFVLCRPDLSVVAVIELDDRTHAWPKRKAADARKNKALADAGIRLVRIPAGRLPSEDTLRALIDVDSVAEEPQEETALSLVRTVDTYEETSAHRWRDDSGAESRELKRIALKFIAVAILLLGGWFIFSQFLPGAVKQALQPLAIPRVRAASAPPNSIPVAPSRIPTVPVIYGSSAEELAWQKRVQLQAANALQRKKDEAWAAFYSAPASCEHPADWASQVECGNLYMRAKKVFEQRWEAEHASSQGKGADVVLDNRSVGGPHK
jgi:Protein of unknown function (DUF2726)